MLVAVLSASTSMMCQVGSHLCLCHVWPRGHPERNIRPPRFWVSMRENGSFTPFRMTEDREAADLTNPLRVDYSE